MYQRILAAIDATPNEAGVLAQTIQLARLTGAAVHVLHVALYYIGTGDILGGSAAADDVDPREVTVVQDALAQLRKAGVTAEGELVTAPEHDIAAAIVQRAKTLDVQLIVLGSTLHRGASRLFRASVADQVIHQYPSAPILLVPRRSARALTDPVGQRRLADRVRGPLGKVYDPEANMQQRVRLWVVAPAFRHNDDELASDL